MKHLANLLSLLRVLLAPFVLSYGAVGEFWFGLPTEWRAALWLLLIGWATDAFDGPIARWLQKHRGVEPSKLDLDGIGDTVLAFGSALVPVVYYTWIDPASTWVIYTLWIAYALTIIVGGWMAAVMGKTDSAVTKKLITVNMIFFHGLIQIVGTIGWFAYMAYDWIGPIVVILCMPAVIYFQWEKITLWWRGRLR